MMCSVAHADVRLEAHVAGGLEGGLIQGEDHPDAVSEMGVGASWFAPSWKWGLGVVVERVDRRASDLPVASEYKLDAMVRFGKRDEFAFGFGGGIRKLAVAGEEDRPGSTLWGLDLLRYNFDVRVARVGPVGIDVYFAWTLGMYMGEVYGARSGDMPYPVRDYWTIANSFVLGLQTSFATK